MTALPQTQDARREMKLQELMSDLSDLVESGDMTSEQANEWYNDKADQWSNSGIWS